MQKLFLLIEKILRLRLPMSLTIHFDGLGSFKLESKLGDKATKEVIKVKLNNQ